MLFLTIPTANAHPDLLIDIVENSGVPRDRVILVATRPELVLPPGCIVIEDLGPPNIQRWWNVGIEEAVNRGATAVAVLNDDLRIDRNTLAILHSELVRSQATIASPTRPDWGPGHYKNTNLFPYTPIIWGCLWVLDTSSRLRPNPEYVWWYGDSDLDISARRDYAGIVTADVYYEHFFSGKGTSASSNLIEQTDRDAKRFESSHREFLKTSRSASPRKLFMQTQQFAGRMQDEPGYREAFFHYVSKIGNPERDRVVLVEPNRDEHQSLRELWSTWSNLLIVNKYVTGEQVQNDIERTVLMYRWRSKLRGSRQSRFKLDVNRFEPSFEISEIHVPPITLWDLANQVSPGSELDTLAFDSRVYSLREMANTPTRSREIVTDITDSDGPKISKQAKEIGLRFVGRPWGEARSTVAFSYRRIAILRATKTTVGHVISTFVDARKRISHSSLVQDFVETRITRTFTKADILDRNHAQPVPAISRPDIESALRIVAATTNAPVPNSSEWQIDVDTAAEVHQRVKKCFDTHGVWPLSMSIPNYTDINPDPSEIVSPIMPGYPYSFHSEREYLAKYSEAYFALTHRKAGWDCFRHVEIMASGSAPLMLDAHQIPEFSMTHYPKLAFARIAQKALEDGGRPNGELRVELRNFFLTHLTTKAMAAYILASAQIPTDSRILFLDENLPTNPEYISTLTAIGLKENLGRNCTLYFPGEYLYQDSLRDTNAFYGRGFGYVKKLDPELRSNRECEKYPEAPWHEIDPDLYDYVVIGSVSRNESFTQIAVNRFPSKNVVLIHGEDLPPTVSQASFLKKSGAHVFVRSLY